MFVLWVVTFTAEGMLYIIPFAWKFRRILSLLLGLAIIVSVLGLLGRIGIGAWLTLGFLTAYRLGNLLRTIKGRMHKQYLKRAAGRSSLWIFLIHALVLAAIILPLALAPNSFWHTLAVLQLLVSIGFLAIVVKNITKLRFQMPQVFLIDRELPTVTVAIPARNETIDLEACLKSILANDYPKIEVLVLDDCSQVQTADIIRSFAHDGVRFIKGQDPAERWLAKNQAYQKLYEEATGDLILFCGVDARFGPQSIRGMVNLLASRRKSMLSVLPIRKYSSAASAFIQPMRYWWELALPRRLFNRPPVLSTCWIIGRQDLKRLGGFAAVSHAILPERYFASQMVQSDQYSFVRSSAELQIETSKNFQEQYSTALRTKYPLVRRRPENVLTATFFNIIFFLGPFTGLAAGFWANTGLILPAISCLLLVAAHVLIVNITDPANSLLAAFTFPFAVLVDMYVLYSSMIRYEFLGMEWKDRNICIPVMHTIPKLPPLSDSPSTARPA